MAYDSESLRFQLNLKKTLHIHKVISRFSLVTTELKYIIFSETFTHLLFKAKKDARDPRKMAINILLLLPLLAAIFGGLNIVRALDDDQQCLLLCFFMI